MEPGLKDVLSRKEITKIVERKMGTKDFRIEDCILRSIDKVMGFMGSYYRLTVTVQLPDWSNEQDLRFFVKRLPSSTFCKEILRTHGGFQKEVAAYTKIFNAFESLTWSPRCYLSRDNDILVLDDLASDGFEMCSKFVYFDLQKCEMTLKKLSQLHAQSLILEERTKLTGSAKSLLDLFGEHLKEGYMIDNEMIKPYIQKCINVIVKALEILDLPKPEEKLLQESVPEILPQIVDMLKPSKTFRNVMCHGDLWCNNVLFKWKDARIEDCALVDYQLTRYNPPAHDVMLFLHLNTSPAFRKLHSDGLLRFYHKNLESALARCQIQLERILPLDSFLESCRYYTPQAVLMLNIYFPMIMMSDETTQRNCSGDEESFFLCDRVTLISKHLQQDPVYRAKMTDGLTAYKDMYYTFFAQK